MDQVTLAVSVDSSVAISTLPTEHTSQTSQTYIPNQQSDLKYLHDPVDAIKLVVLQGTIVDMDIICINWTIFIYQSHYAQTRGPGQQKTIILRVLHVKQSSKTYVFRISAIHPTWQYFRTLQLWKQVLRYQSVKHIAVTYQHTDLFQKKQRREGGGNRRFTRSQRRKPTT